MEAIFQRFLSGREPEQLSVKEKRQLVYELRRDGVFVQGQSQPGLAAASRVGKNGLPLSESGKLR